MSLALWKCSLEANQFSFKNRKLKIDNGIFRLILAGVFLILSGLGIVFIYQKIASSVRRLLPKKEEPTLILPPKPAKEDKPKATVTIPIIEKEDNIVEKTPKEAPEETTEEFIQRKFSREDYYEHTDASAFDGELPATD